MQEKTQAETIKEALDSAFEIAKETLTNSNISEVTVEVQGIKITLKKS